MCSTHMDMVSVWGPKLLGLSTWELCAVTLHGNTTLEFIGIHTHTYKTNISDYNTCTATIFTLYSYIQEVLRGKVSDTKNLILCPKDQSDTFFRAKATSESRSEPFYPRNPRICRSEEFITSSALLATCLYLTQTHILAIDILWTIIESFYSISISLAWSLFSFFHQVESREYSPSSICINWF